MNRIVFIITSCRRTGPIRVITNIIKYLDRERFEPILITLYEERKDSQLATILPYVSAHYLIKTKRTRIIIGNNLELKRILHKLKPDVIHSTGVLPDYTISRLLPNKQIITIHSHIYKDNISKYGIIRGTFLAKLQLLAIKRAAYTVTCSKSLGDIYREDYNLCFEYIRNGIDTGIYSIVSLEEKKECRKHLLIPDKAFVFIYTGQISAIKNVDFLLKGFVNQFQNIPDVYCVILGDGPQKDRLKEKYKSFTNVLFRGPVDNVNEYLSASDVYVSASKSEGMPNSVLEAMASGLPVVLSNIIQHLEILDINNLGGFSFKQGDCMDLMRQLQTAYNCNYEEHSKAAYSIVHSSFDAKMMSQQYQSYYNKIINNINSV